MVLVLNSGSLQTKGRNSCQTKLSRQQNVSSDILGVAVKGQSAVIYTKSIRNFSRLIFSLICLVMNPLAAFLHIVARAIIYNVTHALGTESGTVRWASFCTRCNSASLAAGGGGSWRCVSYGAGAAR